MLYIPLFYPRVSFQRSEGNRCKDKDSDVDRLGIKNALFYIITRGFEVLMEFCGFSFRDFDMLIFNSKPSVFLLEKWKNLI